VFDFDKFEINDFNKKMINDFVANTIMDNSKVSITGSTDKLGEKDYNMNLSLSRAESTYKVIKKIKPKADFKEVTGIGNTKLLYDNSLPEGRFYCRTVLIEVTTPIN
jgi:outer membrane protein OmpA-like peptidoglycan-associated protein